jgi:hypothetical protein
MSFELPPDPDAEPQAVETSTLLIYLRGGQTIRHDVTSWHVTLDPGKQNVTHLAWDDRWPGQEMPFIRRDAIDAVVVMSAVAPL